MKKLNYGIISAASIVLRFVEGLNETKHSRALAIGTSSLARAEKMAEQLKIPRSYGSYEEIYRDSDIDVVYIANINDQHFPEIMKALSQEKHVVCENPMVLTPKQVDDAFALAKKKMFFLWKRKNQCFYQAQSLSKIKLMMENMIL